MINTSTEYLLFYNNSTDEYFYTAPGEQLPELTDEITPLMPEEKKRYVGWIVSLDIRKSTGCPRGPGQRVKM